MKLNKSIPMAVMLLCGAYGASAAVLGECPAGTVSGSAYTGCNFVITENANGTYTTAVDSTQPFFGGEDNYAGFRNNTSRSVSSLVINGNGTTLFAFDGDGPGLFPGTTGYEGPDNTFSQISPDLTTGTVNFITPIAAGASTYFFLEEAIPSTGPPPTGGSTPEPATLGLMGASFFGMGCYALRRKRAAQIS